MGPQGGDFCADLLDEPGGVTSYLIQDEEWQVRVMGDEVDIGGDDFFDLFVEGGCLVQEADRNPFYKLPEVVQHDDVEQFFLAPEIVVEEGQVDAGLFGNVAGTGGGEAFFGEEFFGGLHDLFFRGYICGDRSGGLFFCWGTFFTCCFCHWFLLCFGNKDTLDFDLNKFFNQMIKNERLIIP